MKRSETFYDALGIDRASATAGVIDAGYKATFERIKRDLQGDPEKLELALQEINLAHGILIKPQSKAEYDRKLDIQAKNTIEALRKQVQSQVRPEKVAEQIISSANNVVENHRKSIRRRLLAIMVIFSVLLGSLFYVYYAQKGSKSAPPSKREPTKEQKKQTSSSRTKDQTTRDSVPK